MAVRLAAVQTVLFLGVLSGILIVFRQQKLGKAPTIFLEREEKLASLAAPSHAKHMEYDWFSKQLVEPEVPFYLYPFEQFPSLRFCDFARSKTPKHDHAIFAWDAMMRHPWRTTNPLEAKLAVLPLALDLRSRGGCKPEVEIMSEVNKAVAASQIFPSVRHLFIANDWKTKKLSIRVQGALFPAGIMVGQEGRGDCRISLGYTSNYAVYMSWREPGHTYMPGQPRFGSERIYAVNFVGQVDKREAYHDRLALFQSTGAIPSPFITSQLNKQLPTNNTTLCMNSTEVYRYDRCFTTNGFPSRMDTQRALELSNYTICLRGDKLGSDRWINGMAAGTALIAVVDSAQELEWLPFPDAVPWKDLVIQIPRKKYHQDPAAAIRQVVENTTEERLLELQRLSLYYVADIDWVAYHSRALENLLREAASIPCKPFDKYQAVKNRNNT